MSMRSFSMIRPGPSPTSDDLPQPVLEACPERSSRSLNDGWFAKAEQPHAGHLKAHTVATPWAGQKRRHRTLQPQGPSLYRRENYHRDVIRSRTVHRVKSHAFA